MTDPGSNTENPNLGVPLDIEDFSNMIEFANASAALEFLLTLKSGIRNTAMALTECVTPEIRRIVRNQLFQGLELHEKLSTLMIEKGWLDPHQPNAQFQFDQASAKRTAFLANLPLFKDRIQVLASFDTPQKPN